MVTFHVEIEGSGPSIAFTSEAEACAWVDANRELGVPYTVTQVDGAFELVPMDPEAAKYAIRISTAK